jgi:peptide/nickel transport system substrate-binding protein
MSMHETRFDLLTRRGLLAVVTAGLVATGFEAAPATAQDRFVFANSSAYDTLDPHAVFDIGRIASRLNLYDGLMRWEDNPPQLQPWLAESYEISDDGLTYTFKLREGALFHDGSEIMADDVVYSAERILALGLGAAGLFAPILDPGATKAVDDHTVEFTLKEPSAVFLALLPELHVLNSDLVKEHEQDGDWGAAWLSENDAGSGSYVLDRYDPARGFTAVRFPDHFMGWGDKYVEEIEFRTVLETNSRVLGLLRGDFHGSDGYMPQDQIQRLEESDDVKVMEEESMRIFYAIIHNNRPPMNDLNFRLALSHAFDYDGFINDILSGSVERDPVPLPNNIWGAPDDIEGYDYDLEKAQVYLDKYKESAGVEEIPEVTIGSLVGYEQTEQAAALLQNGLNKIGVPTTLKSEPWPVVSNKMRDEQQMYDLLFLWRSTYYADPNNWIGEMYNSKQWGSRNNSYYKNPEVDALLDEALLVTDQEKRAELYRQAAHKVFEDAAGIWVYNTKWYGPFAANVQGVRFCPIGDGQEMRWVYFDES